jgi:hypothetical protein
MVIFFEDDSSDFFSIISASSLGVTVSCLLHRVKCYIIRCKEYKYVDIVYSLK